MNALRNKVNMIGRLGAKPEIITVSGGHVLTRFSIAINERKKDKSGAWQNDTQWHTLTAWGKLAENISKFADKGNEIAIEGRLINKNYQTKDGERRYVSEIEISDFIVFNLKNEN